MLKDETFFKQVNRRLLAAELLLASIDDPSHKATPVTCQALLESSILQFYFAVYSYLNELLSYYHKPKIDDPSIDLESLFSKRKILFDGVREFEAIQEWSKSNGDVLQVLSRHPLDMLELSSKENAQVNDVVSDGKRNDESLLKDAQLIAVSRKDSIFEFNDVHKVKNIYAGFKQLIDSQRENQSEY